MKNKELIGQERGYLAAAEFNAHNGLIEELDGLTSTFDKIKIPAGGGLTFEVPGDNGESEAAKEIEGVILYHHALNSYYKDKYTGGSNPPDCGSLDGKAGEGNPGGRCINCPYNQFGTGENGSGKACKNKRRIFILREGEVFPILLTLPTGSLKGFTAFIRRIVTKGKRCHTLVTKISLKKAVSSRGIQFSQAVFRVLRDLNGEEIQAVMPLVNHVKEMSKSIALDIDTENCDNYTVDKETGEIIPLV